MVTRPIVVMGFSLCLVLAILVFTGCGRSPSNPPSPHANSGAPPAPSASAPQPLRSAPYEVGPRAVVLNPNATSWVPQLPDVDRFQAGLLNFLRTKPPERSPELYKKIVGYYWQYWAIVDESRPGQFHMVGNFMCEPESHWRSTEVTVDDGGDCYGQVTFDPKTGRFLAVYVNGDA